MDERPIEQILLHLYNSIDAGFSYRAKKLFWIDDLFLSSNWGLEKKEFHNSFKNLKRSKFIIQKEQYDGSVLVSLSEEGKLRALTIKFNLLSRKKGAWDRKWRMVASDIPNTHRKGRRALRYRLKIAGFKELQESMFICPYDCEREVRDFVKLFKLEKYVRFGLLDYIDGQEYFIKMYKLSI